MQIVSKDRNYPNTLKIEFEWSECSQSQVEMATNRGKRGNYSAQLVNIWLANALLCVGANDGEPDSIRNRLKFVNPFVFGDKKQTKIIIRLFRFCLLLYCLHHTCICLFCLILQYERDRLLVGWQPEAKFVNNSACDSIEHLEFVKNDDADKFISINRLNRLLQDPGDSYSLQTRGLPVHMFATHLVVLFCYFYYSIYICHKRKIRIDLFSFLIDSKKERARVQEQIHTIHYDVLRSQGFSSFESSSRSDKECECQGKMYLKSLGSPKNKTAASMSSDQVLRDLLTTSNVEILIELKTSKFQSIQPANLTGRWLRNMRRSISICLMTTLLANVTLTSLGNVGYIYTELDLRIKQELQQLNCSNSDNHQLTGFRDFSIAKLDFQQRRVYESYRHSEENASYTQIIWIELTRYLSFPTIVSIIRHHIALCLESIWVSGFMTLHIFCHLDRTVWLDQIQRQIKTCTRKTYWLKNVSGFHCQIDDEGSIRQEHKSLAKIILIAYINLELFRKNQRNFKELVSLFIFQGGTFCASTLILVYFVGTKLDLNPKYISLIAATYYVLLGNFYLLFGALLTSKVEKIRKSILELLAASKHTPLEQNHFMDLWLRQLTSPSETRELLSPNFLGIYLSWSRLITINAYLAGLYITLLR